MSIRLSHCQWECRNRALLSSWRRLIGVQGRCIQNTQIKKGSHGWWQLRMLLKNHWWLQVPEMWWSHGFVRWSPRDQKLIPPLHRLLRESIVPRVPLLRQLPWMILGWNKIHGEGTKQRANLLNRQDVRPMQWMLQMLLRQSSTRLRRTFSRRWQKSWRQAWLWSMRSRQAIHGKSRCRLIWRSWNSRILSSPSGFMRVQRGRASWQIRLSRCMRSNRSNRELLQLFLRTCSSAKLIFTIMEKLSWLWETSSRKFRRAWEMIFINRPRGLSGLSQGSSSVGSD